MGIGNKKKKRIIIFSIIPILISVPFLTDDIVFRVIASALLAIYIGFIIFLRDSLKTPPEKYHDKEYDDEYSAGDEQEDEGFEVKQSFRPDDGEDFKIISSSGGIEPISSGDSTDSIRGGKKTFFKPPDLKENFERIATEQLPENIGYNEHFSFLLEKILNVIKEAFLAHTAVFFWYNKKKQRLTLERYASSAKEITQQKFDIEDDILSKIVQKEEPELLTDIPATAEKDVIRYYDNPLGIKSFVGVPLFYGDQLTGVLALDSKVTDAFGIETIYSLGRFVRVISLVITLFEEKYSDSQAEQRLKAFLGLTIGDRKFDSHKDLYNAIENAVKGLLNWDVFTFVYFDPVQQKFLSSKINNRRSLKYIGENLEIELTNTLVGKAIINGVPVYKEDTSKGDIIRFSESEDVTFDGSFLAIPLTYDGQNYGVLCFESLKKGVYNTADIDFMKKAGKILAYFVYSFSSQRLLKNILPYDVETRLFNKEAFFKELTKELYKAEQLDIPGALALIKIDDFLEDENLFEGNPLSKVIKAVAQTVEQESTPMNISGRLDDKLLCVYFFNATTKDVFLWSEKVRVKIARKPIAVISKQTTFTVSIGVASASKKTNAEDVIYNAELALRKAEEKGGNSVKSI